MSRGLGEMQSAILMSLEPAKKAFEAGKFKYIGGADAENVMSHMTRRRGKLQYPDEGPLVRVAREYTTLDEGVYDLRATLVFLALAQKPRSRGHFPSSKRHPIASQNLDRESGYQWIDSSFRNSFTRAARSLVKDGMLIDLDPELPQLRMVALRPDLEKLYGPGSQD